LRHFAILCALMAVSLSASGQIMIDTFAGGHIRSGVSAKTVAFGIINGVTRDPKGNLVFCEGSTHVIRRINADGTVQTIAGTGTPGYSGDGGSALSALLNYPGYPKYDTTGNLYFVDNNRIRRIDTSGTITTVAGTGIYGTLGTGGSALLAQIYYVTDLVIDSAGYIYFSEYSQPLLRRITPSGQVEVFAGCATCKDVDGAPATQSSFDSVAAMSFDSGGTCTWLVPTGSKAMYIEFRPMESSIILPASDRRASAPNPVMAAQRLPRPQASLSVWLPTWPATFTRRKTSTESAAWPSGVLEPMEIST
jgi:hypothetical protein